MTRNRRLSIGLIPLVLLLTGVGRGEVPRTSGSAGEAAGRPIEGSTPGTLAYGSQVSAGTPRNILTIDHFVPHVSTVPANEGQAVELFVRERVRRGHRHRGVVLMVQGGTQPTVPIYDLRFQDYSWMAFLARAGFDVFAMDLTGYGSSPRPMMDNPCNASRADQEALLIPNPLSEPCEPGYPFRLSTSQSDWDEIDTVVDYLRELRDVDKVSLIGWSLGGPRTGGYAARHPEKVERLLLYAPNYIRSEPSDPPAILPQPGVPTTVRTIASFLSGWDSEVHCSDQFTPAIRDELRRAILAADPVGRTWGTQDLWRAPVQHARWGWNRTFASRIEAPTLIIRGDLDTVVPEVEPQNLYADLFTPEKVFVHVECAGHRLVWENQHTILLRASAEWLRYGTFVGQTTGAFFVDVDGNAYRDAMHLAKEDCHETRLPLGSCRDCRAAACTDGQQASLPGMGNRRRISGSVTRRNLGWRRAVGERKRRNDPDNGPLGPLYLHGACQ